MHQSIYYNTRVLQFSIGSVFSYLGRIDECVLLKHSFRNKPPDHDVGKCQQQESGGEITTSLTKNTKNPTVIV